MLDYLLLLLLGVELSLTQGSKEESIMFGSTSQFIRLVTLFRFSAGLGGPGGALLF
jgi:hypothetical protein